MGYTNIKELFSGMQEQMLATLKTQKQINHPGAKGSASEINWIEWFREYLPKRYAVDKGFVVDSNGNTSDEIDVIIYDKQYSPLIFNQNGILYVTAESVYAIFEIKQNITVEHIEYASKKSKSVRKLFRTSKPIRHAGGTYAPKPLHRIISGLLSAKSDLKGNVQDSISKKIKSYTYEESLDFICGLSNFSCAVNYYKTQFSLEDQIEKDDFNIEIAKKEENLIFLFIKILMKLQDIATVPAIELIKYAQELDSIDKTEEEV